MLLRIHMCRLPTFREVIRNLIHTSTPPPAERERERDTHTHTQNGQGPCTDCNANSAPWSHTKQWPVLAHLTLTTGRRPSNTFKLRGEHDSTYAQSNTHKCRITHSDSRISFRMLTSQGSEAYKLT